MGNLKDLWANCSVKNENPHLLIIYSLKIQRIQAKIHHVSKQLTPKWLFPQSTCTYSDSNNLKNFVKCSTLFCSHKIESGTWASIKLTQAGKKISLRDAVSKWMAQAKPVRITDGCMGAHCNPDCPDDLVFSDAGAAWGKLIEAVIIGLSLVITVLCLVIKVSLMGYHAFLVSCQRRYLWESEVSKARKEVRLCRNSCGQTDSQVD